MTQVQVCPQCASELPADALQGLCPRCLLQEGLTGPEMSERHGDPERRDSRAAFTPPAPNELAPHFPQLDRFELIGQGGMGVVYRARQTKIDRPVALKVLPREMACDPAFAERFTREARALARLNDPGIVTIHDFGQVDGLYFFLMEFVDGVNLRQLMQAGTLEPRRALEIVLQICDALQYAHDEGIAHRDIKPENILLDRRGRVKIADFGLAKLLGRSPAEASGPPLTAFQQVLGTYHYMAPEQMERPQEVDHRADVYALGVVFYEMLTGQLPEGSFPLPSQVQLNAQLDPVVQRALQRKSERRYQRVSELKADVEAIMNRTSQTPYRAGYSLGRWVSLCLEGFQAVVSRPMAPTAPAGPSEPEQARPDAAVLRQVQWPAIGLLATGVVAILTSPLLLLFFIGPVILGALLLFTALKMRRLEGYDLVRAASILALLPWSPAVALGLPVGIWVLVVLHRPGVKAAFAAARPGGRTTYQRRAPSTDRPPDGAVPAAKPPEPEERPAAASDTSAALPPPVAVPEPVTSAGPAAAEVAPPTPVASPPLDLDQVQLRVKGPAAGLLLTGLLALLQWMTAALVGGILLVHSDLLPESEVRRAGLSLAAVWLLGAVVVAGATLLSGLIIVGGLRMSRLQTYELPVMASVLAVLPWSVHFLVGLPTGIWAFWTLARPEVKTAFVLARRRPPRPGLVGLLLGSTTGWAMILCLAGVAGSLAPLFPWAEVGSVRVYGCNCWQGIAAGWTFLGLGLLLIVLGFREPLPAWQPALLTLAGVSVLVLTALYLPTIPPPDRVHLGPSVVLGLALGLLLLSALQIRGLLARARSPVESESTRESQS